MGTTDGTWVTCTSVKAQLVPNYISGYHMLLLSILSYFMSIVLLISARQYQTTPMSYSSIATQLKTVGASLTDCSPDMSLI